MLIGWLNRFKTLFVFILPKTWLSELIVSSLYYTIHWRKLPNILCPKEFHEFILSYRLFYRPDGLEKFVDKYEVRYYVENVIGSQYLVPLLGVYASLNDVDFSAIDKEVMVKTTHDSGGVYRYVPGLSDIDKLQKRIRERMNVNYYRLSREYVYKKVEPRIIIEESLGSDIRDFKIFTYLGSPKYIMVVSGRETVLKREFYAISDSSFTSREISDSSLYLSEHLSQKSFERIVEIASELAKGFPFLRVDLYIVDERIYFGELTFYPWGGVEKIKETNALQVINKPFLDYESMCYGRGWNDRLFSSAKID